VQEDLNCYWSNGCISALKENEVDGVLGWYLGGWGLLFAFIMGKNGMWSGSDAVDLNAMNRAIF
jgi:hypothetical protein